MNVEEMHASILLKIDKVGSYSTSNLIPGEIDDFINESIRDYVNQQKIRLREYDGNVDASAEAQENLRSLVNRKNITTINQNAVLDEDGFEIDLSSLTPNYDYFISGKADFNGEWSLLKPVSSGYLTDENVNKYKSPFLKGVPIAVEDTLIVGVHPNTDTTPNSAIITYLQEPDYVNLNAEDNSNLPNHTHRTIVNIASRKIISSLSGQQPRQREAEEE